MKEILELLYCNELMTQQEISEIFGVAPQTICKWMARLEIPARRVGPGPGHLCTQWNGGRIVSRERVYHWMPDHPNANHKGYVEEGRLVLEDILGDFLPEGSVVHHFNKDPGDNRPENLMYFDGQAGHIGYHNRKKTWRL